MIFRALLYGGMRESVPQATIHVDDTTSEAFQLLLTYIYTGKLNLSDLKVCLSHEILLRKYIEIHPYIERANMKIKTKEI